MISYCDLKYAWISLISCQGVKLESVKLHRLFSPTINNKYMTHDISETEGASTRHPNNMHE